MRSTASILFFDAALKAPHVGPARALWRNVVCLTPFCRLLDPFGLTLRGEPLTFNAVILSWTSVLGCLLVCLFLPCLGVVFVVQLQLSLKGHRPDACTVHVEHVFLPAKNPVFQSKSLHHFAIVGDSPPHSTLNEGATSLQSAPIQVHWRFGSHGQAHAITACDCVA